jgi:AcrR family transcriptional regulator
MPTDLDSPRQRLLDAATRLFYGQGIHAVGVDRLVREAGVTRATFYRHFPSKEDLVEAYLRATDAELRGAVEAAAASGSAESALAAVFELVGSVTSTANFRGCHFINAAAEYPDAKDPVRIAIDDHRRWFSETLTVLARQAGHPDPGYAAAVLVLLHDGTLAGAELDDPAAVRKTLRRAVGELLTEPSRTAGAKRSKRRAPST